MNDLIVIVERAARRLNTKVLWRFHLAASALPLTWALLMCIYSLDVLLHLGHWPHPMVEATPQDVFSSFLEAVTGILYLCLPLTSLVWVILTSWRWKRYALAQRLWQVGLCTAGVIAALIFMWANPGRFFDWWID